jgi:hypothetical protein
LKIPEKGFLGSARNILSTFKLPPPGCVGKLGACNRAAGVVPIDRFRSSCLFCPWRRTYYSGYTKPPYYLEYVYVNVYNTYLVDRYVSHGKVFTRRDGRPFVVHRRHSVFVDPRGHFLRWRMAAIQVLDALIGLARRRKPLIEFAEFLAHYPVW